VIFLNEIYSNVEHSFHLKVNVVISWNIGSVTEKQRITLILAITEEKNDNVKKPENYFWSTSCSSWGKYKTMAISLKSDDNTPVPATTCEFQILSSSKFLSEIISYSYFFFYYFNRFKWILINQEELFITERFILLF